jgi:hypothetical protein
MVVVEDAQRFDSVGDGDATIPDEQQVLSAKTQYGPDGEIDFPPKAIFRAVSAGVAPNDSPPTIPIELSTAWLANCSKEDDAIA